MTRAKLLWEEPVGHSRFAPALIEDESDRGLSLRVGQKISIGSKLEVRWHKAQLWGVVMNCHKDGFDYILGIRRDFDYSVGGNPNS